MQHRKHPAASWFYSESHILALLNSINLFLALDTFFLLFHKNGIEFQATIRVRTEQSRKVLLKNVRAPETARISTANKKSHEVSEQISRWKSHSASSQIITSWCRDNDLVDTNRAQELRSFLFHI